MRRVVWFMTYLKYTNYQSMRKRRWDTENGVSGKKLQEECGDSLLSNSYEVFPENI